MELEKVLEHFGGPSALAEKLNIARQAIYQWENGIPLLRQYQIQALTDGKFKVSTEQAA